MAVKIGPVIGVEGEKTFRAAFKEIIAQARELDSEMNKLTASFSKNDSALTKNARTQEQLRKEIDKQRDVVEKAKRMHEDAIKAETKSGVAYLDSKDKLAKLNQTREEARQKIMKLIDEYGYEHPYVQGAISGYNKLGVEIKEAENNVEKMSTAVHRSGEVTATWGTAVNDAETRLEELKRQLEDMPSKMQIVGENMQKVGSAFEEVGTAMMRYVTAPLVAAGGAFVKWSSDFTDGMAKIYTIADEGKKPMSEMREELIQLSNQTGYSLEDLAEAEYQAVSASVDTSKAVQFLGDATKLARGGFTSTTNAVDLLTTVINAYGYEAEDAAYISDVLLRTQNDGKTIIDELAGSMGTVIPTAANYNVSLEQLAAAYATMTKQGVNTSRATTFLNAMFTELEKESSTISKTLDTKTGKSFAQLMGEGKSLADVLKILYDAVDGDNEQFQRLFGNIRSGKAAAALLTDDFAILNYETERMADATGQTAEAMEVLETPSLKVKRAIQQLKNSGMELGTALINKLAPALEKVLTAIKGFTDYISNLNDRSMGMILTFGALVAATAPVLTIVGKLTTGIGALMAGIAAGTLPLTTTIGLFVGLTEGLMALFVAGEVQAEQHRQAIQDLYKMDEETQALVESSHQLNEQYHASKDAIAEKQEANLAELGYAETLIDRYNNLIDADGKVIEGKERIADIILTELAEALGLEKSQVEELIEENGKFGDSIDETIDKMKERAKLAAAEEYLTEAYKRTYEAEVELEKMAGKLAEAHLQTSNAEADLKEKQDAVNAAVENGIDVTEEQAQALIDAQTAYDAAKAYEDELQAQYNETAAVKEECEADIEAANAAIVGNSEKTVKEMAKVIHGGGASVGRESKYVADQAKENLKVDNGSLGYAFVTGFSSAISKFSYLASSAAAAMAQGASHAARINLRVGSPSKVMAEVGKYFDQGFAIGIEGNMREVEQAASMLANSAVGGVQMIGYEPPTTYSRTISAPISITLNIEGNVDGDDRGFARNIAEDLVNLMNRESEVFA